MPAIYDSAAKALSALDFEADNAALAERAAEGEKLSAAMRKAEARLAEIQGLLAAIAQDKLAASRTAATVADALLSDSDASQATANVIRERDLREEQTSLRAGLRELQDRSRDNGEEMARLKHAALGKVVPALEPVTAALVAEVQAAADQIGRAFASLSAINGATRHFYRETRDVGDCIAGLMATPLIQRHNLIDTPEDIAEMLAPLASKGPAAAGHVPTSAAVP